MTFDLHGALTGERQKTTLATLIGPKWPEIDDQLDPQKTAKKCSIT